MKEFTYTITDEQGIHARPAGLLVKEAAGFASAITIEKDEMCIRDRYTIIAINNRLEKQRRL